MVVLSRNSTSARVPSLSKAWPKIPVLEVSFEVQLTMNPPSVKAAIAGSAWSVSVVVLTGVEAAVAQGSNRR